MFTYCKEAETRTQTELINNYRGVSNKAKPKANVYKFLQYSHSRLSNPKHNPMGTDKNALDHAITVKA